MAPQNFKQWMYRGNRPQLLARVLNRFWAWVHASGIARDYLVTLEVVGRKSGRIISFPLVMVVWEGDRYLASMLGREAQWVANVRAAEGRAVLLCGTRSEVRLEEVDPARCAPILKRYLQKAPGARPHFPLHKDAPLDEFERISADFPVFRVLPGE